MAKNTKARGASLERRFISLLEDHGYVCEKARAQYAMRMGGPPRAVAHDLFGALDLVAKKRGQRSVWAQVTTENVSIASKARTFLERCAAHFDQQYDEVLIVRWKKPSKPGERGEWQVCRWADDFDPKKAHLIASNAHTLSWEHPT